MKLNLSVLLVFCALAIHSFVSTSAQADENGLQPRPTSLLLGKWDIYFTWLYPTYQNEHSITDESGPTEFLANQTCANDDDFFACSWSQLSPSAVLITYQVQHPIDPNARNPIAYYRGTFITQDSIQGTMTVQYGTEHGIWRAVRRP